MISDNSSGKARIIKADRLLQAKVGSGSIEDDKVQKMQHVMDNTKVDFAPMATKFLEELRVALEKSKKGEEDQAALIAQMTEPVMQIKANAAMFNYQLVSALANIVLNFLENIDAVDKSVIDIVEAHYKTLCLIVNNKMSGAGGAYGSQLQNELKEACKRFFAKKGAEIYFVE